MSARECVKIEGLGQYVDWETDILANVLVCGNAGPWVYTPPVQVHLKKRQGRGIAHT